MLVSLAATMCGITSLNTRRILSRPMAIVMIVLALVPDRLNCEESYENFTMNSYRQLRQLYPSISSAEAHNWRMARNEDFDQHPCKRSCVADQPMTCYYYFVIHYDKTMSDSCARYLTAPYVFRSSGESYVDATKVREHSGYDDCKYADGNSIDVLVANGQLPGQSIELCEGDTLVADVINSMHETTTVHWHGLHMKSSPHMDGVPLVTQYPIEPGQAYRYRFEVDRAGTNWWHSHTDHQRSFGLSGALIVRQPDSTNPHRKLYDYDYSEHVIMLQDWLYDNKETVAGNLLINGLGRSMNNRPSLKPTMYANFNVVRGGRYRFRVILNGITNCPVTMSIDDHDLVVISSDGYDIEPVHVQKLTIHGGERFDFVLHANQDIRNYWMRVKGHVFCGNNTLHQEAVIQYAGAKFRNLPKARPSYDYEREGIVLNAIDAPPKNDPNVINLVELNALPQNFEGPLGTPDRTFYSSLYVNTSQKFIFQMDDITFTMPKVSMLQTRNLGIHSLFCNKTEMAQNGINCRRQSCECTNVIQVPAFKTVEFVISSTTNTGHPMHLHGYSFRVVGMGVLGPKRIRNIEQIDRKNPLPRRVRGAPLKDTVQVPAYGYTIIRFYTDNPGYWVFHCHISIHSEHGMGSVLRIGEDVEMKMCPVSNCGLCSSVL